MNLSRLFRSQLEYELDIDCDELNKILHFPVILGESTSYATLP